MDKLFTPNKWFVLFCAMFIGVFLLLRFVSGEVLTDVAKRCGAEVFTWNWEDRNLASRVDVKNVKILKSNATDAVVEVSGEQYLLPFDTIVPAEPRHLKKLEPA